MTRDRSIARACSLAVFVFAAFVLSGCGFLSNIFSPHPAEEPAPPFSQPEFATFDQRNYIPDRLLIPSIELDTPVVELGWSAEVGSGGRVFNQWDVAEYAAGWHRNSARLGGGGNVVMSGHNNILGAVFRELDQLREGDIATVTSGGVAYDYEINTVVIVPDKSATEQQRRDNAQWIADYGDNRLTLVSCWPRDDNTHRIIVVGHLKDDDTAHLGGQSAGQ